MLCELRIDNLALISSLELNFEEAEDGGLVVMTGETGAGKSIMLRALHLLSGGRGSADWIRSGADNCTIEAQFEIPEKNRPLLEKLDQSGFGSDPTVIIKRVITSGGRSKLYINGSLATARLVAELTGEMLTIASQHDHQQLLQASSHLDFLDTLGELWQKRKDFSTLYSRWQERRAELGDLHRQEQDKEQRRDFLTFQLTEIEQAEISSGEDEELAAEKRRLKGADALIKLSQESYYLISSEVSEIMDRLRKNMEQLAVLDSGAEKLAEELIGYSFQAEDYITELRNYRDGLENNPHRLEQVTERLDILQGLKRKYGQELDEVLAYADAAKKELAQLENMDRQIAELEGEVAELEKEVCKSGAALSKRRGEVATFMEEAMANELTSLAFQQSGFHVHFEDVDQSAETLRPTGWDRVEFFFSANPGEPPRPLVKVASGGELSRLMLAMKCLLAKKDMVDTVIFDEVDAGIGGEAAEAVARKIQELAGHHQVFCITHLPQIAARGSLHFQVSKAVADGRTQSSVTRLSTDHRVNELARMLAGDSATKQTQAWARELLTKGSVQEINSYEKN